MTIKKGHRVDLAFLLLLLSGIALRIAFWWINPPENVFDDHLEPIQRILATGKIPDAYACWQCYQPPIFYVFSAMLAKIALGTMLADTGLAKFLQFVSCLFSLLNLWLLLLIVRRFPFADWYRVLLFGIFCVLPRDVYMAGMHSNDTISYCAISLCVYLALRILTDDWRPWLPVALGIAGALALLTKYTAFVVIPIIWFVIGWEFVADRVERQKKLRKSIFAMLLPVLVLGCYLAHNQNSYGRMLPHNDLLFDPATKYAQDREPVNFITFTPWQFVKTPLLVPGQLSSFWTVAYTGLWFDTEPRYVTFVGGDLHWWEPYMGWLKGTVPFPGEPVALPSSVKLIGSFLEAIGLLPLALAGVGLFAAIRGSRRRAAESRIDCALALLFSLLLLTTVAGIILLAVKMPIFSAMKASYFLGALPAFGYFVGKGLMSMPEKSIWRSSLAVCMLIVIVLSAIHLLQVITLFRLPVV